MYTFLGIKWHLSPVYAIARKKYNNNIYLYHITNQNSRQVAALGEKTCRMGKFIGEKKHS
jgi:hypothetical protein